MTQLFKWVDERTGLSQVGQALLFRKIPKGAGWLYTLGFASLFVFIMQIATGLILALFYDPSPDHAYESVSFIQFSLPFGSVLRGLHHWGASAMIVLVGVHLAVVFVLGAFKRPRELTWIVGVVLLLIVIGLGFTGYLLPWDEKAYWATTVGTSMAGTVPFIGDTIMKVIRGGTEVGAVTLTHFYGEHVLLLPGLFIATIFVHLYLVVYLGVSVPPWLWQPKKDNVPADETERYNVFKKQGRPFWPDLILEDAVISLVVFLILTGLALFAGAPLEARADPTTSGYIPRPEWYFLFLFELLKFFPGNLEWVGVVIIPGVIILLLLLLPFYNRAAERRPERRPVAMALGGLGIAAILALTISAAVTTPPSTVVERGVRLSSSQVLGKSLFQANCTSCHGDIGQGTKDGPSIQTVGALRDPAFIHRYIEDPKALNPDAKMTPFIPPPGGVQILTHEQIEDITNYLITFQ
ncbi:MAG: cytochrome b N-terminal domain-containing protein [Anaerolineae bacterium]